MDSERISPDTPDTIEFPLPPDVPADVGITIPVAAGMTLGGAWTDEAIEAALQI